MSLHNETTIKQTRQTRQCDWCNQKINAGQPSVATSGMFDSEFYSGRYHPECAAAITRYYTIRKCWGEEMPNVPMNRGGILERGETETTP